ncbi:TonB-dependent receptor [Candidatus Saganbacteria bacterium]|nr:TonB-dependent receptor [Candidatus Saganbacteria bacterium]
MKKLSVILLYLSFVICHLSFAFEAPRFYGEEITVTATRLPQLQVSSPWKVDVIKDLGNKVTLGDALRDVPGIDVKANGYLGSVVTARLRGSTSQQVLVLLNGRRINSPLLGMIDLNDILLDNAEKVEVARAPLSALYGTDAIGGVINVITRKMDKEYKLAYGTYGTRQIKLAYGGTSLGYIRSDGFRQNSDYTAQNLEQQLNWGDLELNLNYYNADKGVPRVPNSENDPYSASTPNDRQKDQNLYTDLLYKKQAGPVSTQARFYQNQLYEQFHSYNFFTLAFDDTDYRTLQQGVELQQTLDVSKNSNLIYGIEARQDRGASFYAGDHAVSNLAGFGQIQLGRRSFNLVAGTRMDKHSTFGYTMNPRAGVSAQVPGDLTLRASLGNAFKAPTLNDLYWNDPIWQMFGNVNLLPEKSQTAELGLSKELFDRLNLSVNYYTTSITDLILWDWDISTNITRAKNVGAVEVRGAEGEGAYRITPLLEVFSNYTWERSEDVRDTTAAYVGKITPYSPQDKFNVGLKAGHFKIVLSHVGERFADGGNTIRLPGYTVISLWTGRKMGGLNASLGIDNLTDQVYYESVGYHPTTFAQLKYPLPGRRITVSIGGQL